LKALQRFPRLVCASIVLATSVIWTAEAYITGLGRVARVVLSGGSCLGYSAADANDLYSHISEGKIYILSQTHSK